ncbi:MAG: FAD-dependent oxidoreductase [Candidatus Azambacteria bacterium]|nr:FAD-dependent oxidoreductase [Candidatus Azambacteria bacterium]
MYDLIIIGGGPAGTAAAVYAARKKIKTLLITESFGGQSVVSDNIENWVGEKSINGLDLAKKFEAHVRAQEGVEIHMPARAASIRHLKDGWFEVISEKGEVYQTKTVLLVSGGRRRKLGVPGEETFSGKGVAYCATCDAPLFKNKTVAVVGSGNSALEAVIDLIPYATHVYLLVRGAQLKGDVTTQTEVMNSPKVTVLMSAAVKAIAGDKFVKALTYSEGAENEEKTIDVGGVFIEIGSVPNAEIVKDIVRVNDFGEVVVDPVHGITSQAGIWAAGDVTDGPYKQNNIAAGDAVKAVLSIYAYLMKKEKSASQT